MISFYKITDECISNIANIETNIHRTLLSIAQKNEYIRKEELAKIPFHINVIYSATGGKLRETAHSRILADLLTHPLIVKSFITNFIPSITVSSVFYVKREDHNIDVCIKSQEYFIIIENKVNNAREQKQQIYRYVQYASRTYRPSQIYVIYLNPDHLNPPSKFSIRNTFDIIDSSHLIIKSYLHDIIPWIKDDLLPNYMDSELYLHSAIVQYLDYLEDYFETSAKYNNMKKRTETMLIEALGLNKLSKVDQLRVCNDYIEDLGELIDAMNEMATSISTNIIDSWQKELKAANINNISKFNQCREIQIPCCYKGRDIFIGASIEDDKPWFGITHGNNKPIAKQIKNELINVMETNFGETQPEESGWFAWKYTTFNDIISDITTLYNIVNNNI